MPRLFLLGWLAALITIVCFRLLIYKLYWVRRNTRSNPEFWLRWYIVAAIASAAAWGSLAYVAGWQQDMPWVQAFSAFILASVAAGGLIAMSAVLSAAIPYMIIAVLPLSFSLLQQDTTMQILGIVSLLYLVILIRAAVQMNQLQNQSIETRLESDSLFEFLKHSKQETDALQRPLANEQEGYKQLRDQHERLFERMPELLCVIGPHGRIDLANPAMLTQTGFTLSELQIHPFDEFVHPADREQVLQAFNTIGDGARTLQFRCRFLCNDGNYMLLSWHAGIQDGTIYAAARKLKSQSADT